MHEEPQHSPHNPFKASGAWLYKVLGTSVILFGLIILVMLGAQMFAGHKLYQKLEKLDRTQDVLVTDIKVLSEQHAVREIVETKCPVLSPDQRARIAFEIYDACHRHMNYPIYIVLGIIDQESGWNANAQNADAVGLMQVRPSSAIAHFKARGIAFSAEALRDPVMNVTVGLDILFDCQDAAILMGWSPLGQYVRGLFDYNGGGEPYARKVLARAVPYQKQMDAPLRDKIKLPVETDPEPPRTKPARGPRSAAKPETR